MSAPLHMSLRMCVIYCVCVCVCLALLWLRERGQDIVLKPQALSVPVILFDGGSLHISTPSISSFFQFGPSAILSQNVSAPPTDR